MEDARLEDLAILLPALLRSLEALGFVARYLYPPEFTAVMAAAGTPDAALREARPRLASWPEPLAGVRERLETASDEVVTAFDGLRAAQDQGADLRSVFRALRHLPRALEALYPLADGVPPVSRFFLDPAARQDTEALARLADAPPRQDVGVFHFGGEPGARGGFSMYVPEYYTPERAWPLVVALHGGSGNGRAFLWSWLRDARGHGAIVVAPTAIGETSALTGPDIDTPNLDRILEQVWARWRIDPKRLLLTGLSDGGSFSYVSGLEPASPFTHLAPIAAAFHPFLAEMADAERIGNLPIHLTHGVLDWMFPIEMARQVRDALTRAGARVTYRELEDLSHAYPRELNAPILHWLATP